MKIIKKYKKPLLIATSLLLVLIICISGALICKRQKKKQENHTSPTENISESVSTTKPSETGKTKNPTQKSTESTENVTKESTSQAPTETPTEALSEPPTQAPTEAPTQAPTEPVTEPPTEAPTQAPTEPVTEPPTEAPTHPKRGENGVILEELVSYSKQNIGRNIPRNKDELTVCCKGDPEKFFGFEYGISKSDIFNNEVVLGTSLPNDIVSIYGEPFYKYTYNGQSGSSFDIYIYQYGYYTEDEASKIYIEFCFDNNSGKILDHIFVGTRYHLEF